MDRINIEFCIICEDIRPELLNKLTLLGFYGVAPSVIINIAEVGVGKVIRQLMFAFSFKGGQGTYKNLKFVLQDPDKNIISDLVMNDVPAGSRGATMAAVGVGALSVPKAGTYTFKILYDGKEAFKSSFTVIVDPSLLNIKS